ncbi:hypothetical protein, partial [Actinomadura sp. 7K507]|uniref:hypothetical protein n=1 Tax=Actinomadura sp. 7K507 TaxID=2530365 RepID=UPI0014052371
TASTPSASGQDDSPQPRSSTADAPDSITYSGPTTAAEVVGLLPLDAEQIAATVQAARRFITAYGTWRYDESPETYLARLAPLMSAQLRPQMERAATDPTTTTQRHRLQQSSTAQARAEAIRSLGPSSITVIVTGIQHLSTPHTAWQETSRYAVTLTHHAPEKGNGWRVYAFDLAATGDTGDVPDDQRGKTSP